MRCRLCIVTARERYVGSVSLAISYVPVPIDFFGSQRTSRTWSTCASRKPPSMADLAASITAKERGNTSGKADGETGSSVID
jgi:hypothetical protein